MFPALGQDQQVAAADLDALAGTLQPAASGPAVDQQVVVRRAPLHVVAMRLRVVTEGQRVAGLAERMAGQGATQAGGVMKRTPGWAGARRRSVRNASRRRDSAV